MLVRAFLAKFVRPTLPFFATWAYRSQTGFIQQSGGQKRKKVYVPYNDFLASYQKDLNIWIKKGRVD